MQSVSTFRNKATFSDFCGKNANVSRTQGLFHVINIFFGSSVGKV